MGRVVIEGRIGNDIDFGQKGSEGPGRGRFAGAAFAADENAADAHVDGVQDERQLHHVLADDSGEGIDGRSVAHEEFGFLLTRFH